MYAWSGSHLKRLPTRRAIRCLASCIKLSLVEPDAYIHIAILSFSAASFFSVITHTKLTPSRAYFFADITLCHALFGLGRAHILLLSSARTQYHPMILFVPMHGTRTSVLCTTMVTAP
jgi:hypothetical protein